MLINFLMGTAAIGNVNDLVSDFGMGASYDSNDNGSSPFAASITLTVKSDGTWTITVGGDDTLTGTPASGNWVNTPVAGVGNDYEVRFTTANPVGSPTINNSTSGAYTSISSNQTIQILSGTTQGDVRSCDVIVDLRQVGSSTTQLTDTANFECISNA